MDRADQLTALLQQTIERTTVATLTTVAATLSQMAETAPSERKAGIEDCVEMLQHLIATRSTYL